MARREVAVPDVGATEHRHRDDAPHRAVDVAHDAVRKLRRVDLAHCEVIPLDGVADREVVGGDDRRVLRTEIAGPPMECGEIRRHHHGGDHGEDERGGAEGECAGRSAEHGESFPEAARGRVEDCGEGRGKERERYFDVEGDDDFLVSDVDFESDFLPLSFDVVDDDSDFESDLSDVGEDSEESFDSLASDDPLEWRFDGAPAVGPVEARALEHDAHGLEHLGELAAAPRVLLQRLIGERLPLLHLLAAFRALVDVGGHCADTPD